MDHSKAKGVFFCAMKSIFVGVLRGGHGNIFGSPGLRAGGLLAQLCARARSASNSTMTTTAMFFDDEGAKLYTHVAIRAATADEAAF